MPISRIETASLDSALVAPTATALTTASGSAPSYSARAWVNFNGTGTVAIRGSGNVTSITDNGTGDYTVNFTTAMPDANYSVAVSSAAAYGANFNLAVPFASAGGSITEVAPTTSAFRLTTTQSNGAAGDCKYVTVAIFR